MADDSEIIEGVIVPRDQGPVTGYTSARQRSAGYGSRGPYKFDSVKQNAYVHLIRQGVRRVRASEMIGVSYNTVNRYLNEDEAFAEMVSEAEMARVDEVEEALYTEAIRGGNVTAQQVILYNRRSDEWADQRQLKARLEAARVEADEREKAGEASALDGLRDKLLALRDRVTVPPAEPVTEPTVETEMP